MHNDARPRLDAWQPRVCEHGLKLPGNFHIEYRCDTAHTLTVLNTGCGSVQIQGYSAGCELDAILGISTAEPA
jgi:hypothetical protein